MPNEPAEFVFKPPIGRRHVLRVSPEVVEYDGTSVVLADVQHMACYLSSMSMRSMGVKIGSVGTSYQAQYWLADGRTELTVKLSAAGAVRSQRARLEAAFAALDGTVQEVVVPRLVGSAAAAVHAGGTVTIGGRNVLYPSQRGPVATTVAKRVNPDTVAVGPQGVALHSGDKVMGQWAWGDITGAGLANGEVWLATGGGNQKLLPLTALDAHILPELISTVRAG